MPLQSTKYRAVLFDFDGTLTPSLPLWVKAFHIAVEKSGVTFTDEEVIQRFFYRNWADVATELQFASLSAFREEIHRGLRIAFHEAELFPEVLSILESCKEGGLQTALVTSAPRVVLDDVIPRLAMRELFDYIVCADDVKNFKPHPEPVLMTLSALNRAPHEAIMIGDSTADILAGKAAGTATALFMTDDHDAFHKADALRATEPDHIFTDHRELRDIIGLGKI
jgi:HAD superfamily hydrolase (TIGR01509 family)